MRHEQHVFVMYACYSLSTCPPFPPIRSHLRQVSTSPTWLLTPALGILHSLVVLIRWLDICAADRCDGLFHIVAARSVVAHIATSCAGSFPLANAHRRSCCCCFDLAYRGRHKALRLARDTDWQALGPLAWSIPFAVLLNSPLFGQLLYLANAA